MHLEVGILMQCDFVDLPSSRTIVDCGLHLSVAKLGMFCVDNISIPTKNLVSPVTYEMTPPVSILVEHLQIVASLFTSTLCTR